MGTGKRKKPAIEIQLTELQALVDAPLSPASRERLRDIVRTAPSLVVARAARIIRDRSIEGFAADLDRALQRFLVDPVKRDPGCHAKLAVVEALDYGEHGDAQPFLIATRHVQLEPAWGPPVDTAAGLRARGVLALSRLEHPDLPIIAGDLLADPLPPVRQAAAEALAATRQRGYAGLLQLRWNMGDDDPVVIMACMAGLLSLAPDHTLPRLRAALAGGDHPSREAAVIVLAQSGRDEGLDLLLEHIAGQVRSIDRAGALRALGLHRTERALAAALQIVRAGAAADAEATIAGLAARRFETEVVERVRAAVRENGDARLLAALAAAFPTP